MASSLRPLPDLASRDWQDTPHQRKIAVLSSLLAECDRVLDACRAPRKPDEGHAACCPEASAQRFIVRKILAELTADTNAKQEVDR